MKRILLAAVMGAMATSLMGVTLEAKTVECKGTIEGKVESVRLKLDDAGKIVPWDENAWASADKDSYFSFLAENMEEAFEYSHSTLSANGTTSMTVGTTADEMTIRISPNRTRGVYIYRDTGSGNGNSKTPLTCTQI